MTLIKTSLLNGIAVLVKMLTLLGINKLLALYVGPAGYAAFGQFQNAVAIITTFASGAFNNGVTKYTAEYHDEPDLQKKIWRTAGTVSLITSVLASLMIYVFSDDLAEIFLKNVEFSGVFKWFSVGLTFFVFNSLLLAILNGLKDIGRCVVSNILGSLFSLVITGGLALYGGLYGALVALAIYQSFSLLGTLFICRKQVWMSLSSFFGKVDKDITIKLFKFSLMAAVSAACVPTTQMLVRSEIGAELGWTQVGYWEAMWRLSSAYLLVVTTTLAVYYLPRLSELKTFSEIKLEIRAGYKLILPVSVLAGVAIYFLREHLILILFSKEFLPMQALFFWQLIGDSLKVGSWILGYLMLGKAMVKTFIFTEVSSSVFFYFLSVKLLGVFGLEGVVIAYAVNYLLYWIVVWLLIKRNFSTAQEEKAA